MIIKKIFGGGDCETFIIAGLGNPGPEYEKTRHNCGFRTVDEVCRELDVSLTKKKFQSVYGDTKITVKGNEIRVIVMKPQTFMNNSGESIIEASNFYKVPPENIIVVFDDSDIDVGAIRVRSSGKPGTHNGMKSIVSHLGTEDFPRVRIGIGKKMPNADMVKFVLGTFPPEEETTMQESFKKGALAAISIIKNGCDNTMNKFNSKQ